MMFSHRSCFFFIFIGLFLFGGCSRDDSYAYSSGMVELSLERKNTSPARMDSMILPVHAWAKNQSLVQHTFSYSTWNQSSLLIQPDENYPLPVLKRDLDYFLSQSALTSYSIQEHEPTWGLGEFRSKVPLKAKDASWMQDYFIKPGPAFIETKNLNPVVKKPGSDQMTAGEKWIFEANEDSVGNMRFRYYATDPPQNQQAATYEELDSSLSEVIKSMNLFPTDWKLERAASHEEWVWVCLYGPPSEALLDRFEEMNSAIYQHETAEKLSFPDYEKAFSFLDILQSETVFLDEGNDPNETSNLMYSILSDQPRGLNTEYPPILRVNGKPGMIVFMRGDPEIKRGEYFEKIMEDAGRFARDEKLKIQISEAHFDPKRFFFLPE